MRCRKNVKLLSVQEKRLFIEAILGLKGQNSVLHPGSQSRYDDFVELHLMAMMAVTDWAHGDSAFFPWHRELLFRFEQELRAIRPTVTIPYWDWTRGQAPGDPDFPFTHDFIGVDGDGNDNDRVKRDPAFQNANPYPYPFDPNAWTIVVKDGGEPDFLTRDFASRFDAPALPENDVVVNDANGNPVVNSTYRQAISAASYLTLRSQSESIHNLVHRWVMGNMINMTSPNDPVFWLHHAAIDRMWTLWQENNPSLTPYQHVNGLPGHGLNDTLIFFEPGDPAPWVGSATPAQLVDSHAQHGESVWYNSDLPEITLETGPSLSFGDVPEGLTTYRAVHFRINMYRQTRFRITGTPTRNFALTPLGAEFIVEPTFGPDPLDGYVFVQFHAVGATAQSSSVTIEAYIIDEDGYYAASEGGEFVLGSFTVSLSASIVPKASNAVVMVLDRSGSMAASAGGGSTRNSLMKSAVGVFHALLDPADQIGIVSFDDVVETPLNLTTQSAGLGSVLSGNSLDPRGLTGIGLGIQSGSAMLAAATHPNKSLLVLTDGNENVHPYVSELPGGTINSRVYAIGFGLQGQVSDAVLNQITSNTQGDLIITGELASLGESYLLTKYFVQMLAGVTNANIVLDPQSELAWGMEHKVPFQVTDADVNLDVIGLCPLPGLLDFELLTPSGAVITPASATAAPNVEYVQAAEVAFYRLLLPALPADPSGSHGGTWTAVFRLRKPEDIRGLLGRTEISVERLVSSLRGRTLPYSGVVHTRSNLQMKATLQQKSSDPGSLIQVLATLGEYDLPYPGSATVWAEVTAPDGKLSKEALFQVDSGRFAMWYSTSTAGIYKFRVRAEGRTSGGYTFTREKTLTASTFLGGGRGAEGLPESGTETVDRLCGLLECILSGEILHDRALESLSRLGVDVAGLKKCLAAFCTGERQKELDIPPAQAEPSVSPAASKWLQELTRHAVAANADTLFREPDLPTMRVDLRAIDDRPTREARRRRAIDARRAQPLFPPPEDAQGPQGASRRTAPRRRRP